jgi:phosphatidate cytidylyltransferase
MSGALGLRRAGRWGDLGVRLASGLVLAGLGALSVYEGGTFFLAMTVLIFGLMGWELAGLTDDPPQAVLRIVIGLLTALGLGLAQFQGLGLLGLLLAPAVMALTPRRQKALLTVYTFALLVAANEFIALDRRGAVIVVWLVCIVVASDVFGYFAGRTLGGPKFWPAISPKKTWSGTIAGWFGAAAVGVGFALWQGGGWVLVVISPIVAFAGQMGDIVESLIKRRAGVKDASRLIPGHGGLLDRFDALIGAILAVRLLALVMPLPLGMAG